MMSWMHGKHYVKFGAGVPHIARRAFDDNTNALGSFTYAPTLAADGVTVLQSALQNYAAALPSGYSINSGQTHFPLPPAGNRRLHSGSIQSQRALVADAVTKAEARKRCLQEVPGAYPEAFEGAWREFPRERKRGVGQHGPPVD